VTGANGLIGGATAQALRRAGHIVYGLVRDEKQQDILLQNEIIPVFGDTLDIKSFAPLLEKMNVIIDTVVLESAKDPGQTNLNLLEAIASASIKQKMKKRYIFTSGIMVYSYSDIADETYPVNNSYFKWRMELEQTILKHKDVEGVVIRPGFVYGGNGGFISNLWFQPNSSGKAEFYGSAERSWSWIHVSDLADAFVRVVEASGGIVSGEIYNVSDTTRVTCLQARTAFAKAAGIEGPLLMKEPDDLFTKKTNVSAVVSAEKIRRHLGWQPKNGPLLDGIDTYYRSWKAHQLKNNREEKKEAKVEKTTK